MLMIMLMLTIYYLNNNLDLKIKSHRNSSKTVIDRILTLTLEKLPAKDNI